MSDYNLTLFEACEYLNRSKKSLSRYIRRGLLHPQEIKSQQGTLEYRFSRADLEAFRQDETRQETQDTPDKTRQSGQTEATPIKEAKIKEITDETRPDKAGQTSQDKTHKTQETGQDSEIINLLKETTGLLKEQLVKKDEQIKDLGNKIDEMIQRDRETNILIGQLQSKVLMWEQPKEAINADITEETRQDTPDKTGQDKPIKPLKEKKTKQKGTKQTKTKDKKTTEKPKTPEKKGFWRSIFK